MITFEGIPYEAEPAETVLDCLLRHGLEVPSFCRNGACQSCLLKVTSGAVPARTQAGLRLSLAQSGAFCSCICPTDKELTLERLESAQSYGSKILEVRQASSRVAIVRLSRPSGLAFEAGQFVYVRRTVDGIERPYSLASLPSDEFLELHVAIFPDGALSPWLSREVGAELEIRGPFGDCTYVADETEAPLLFAGTGTGLAPLVGVLRSALARGHKGPLYLYHGARDSNDFYFSSELLALRQSQPTLEVNELSTDLVQHVLERHPESKQFRSYLCGAPDFVQKLKKRLYLQGSPLARIHSDPFFSKAPSGVTVSAAP